MELTAPGRVLGGRYRLVEPIARGGMATVWLADDPVLSRRVAVKILRADLAADAATGARFRHEAIAAAKLSHPCIVSTYDTGDDDGTAYIVMELIEGPTLRHLIDETNGLPVRDVVRIGAQVADALDAAHRAGLVHRDVKPANVLVPPRGPVKVTDFGIAKAAGVDDLTRTGTVMGTARYLAPEQVNGRPTDARTDVYALGLLLYEALCGHPPFGGESDIATAMARLTTSAPAVRAERPDVPSAVDDVIHRCMARDPAARFASAAEVRDALEHARLDPTGSIPRPAGASAPRASPPTPGATSGPSTAPVPQPVVPMVEARRPRRQRGWIWVVVLFLVIVAAAAAVAVLASNDDGKRSGGSSAVSLPAASGATLTAAAFDPFGDKEEDSQQVGNAVDGDPASVWSTEQYQNFGEKKGVGLALDLGGEYKVKQVSVVAKQQGWSAQIYTSDRPVSELTTLAAWGNPRAEGSDLGLTHPFDVAGAKARSVLLWLTKLPTGANGTQFLEVAEVKVG